MILLSGCKLGLQSSEGLTEAEDPPPRWLTQWLASWWLLVGSKPQLLLMWTLHWALKIFTTWWLASSRVGNPRESKAEAAMFFMTWPCSYTITSSIFHWSYRPILMKYVRRLHKDMNIRRWGSLGAILEAGYKLYTVFAQYFVFSFFFQFIYISINIAYILFVLGSRCFSKNINS